MERPDPLDPRHPPSCSLKDSKTYIVKPRLFPMSFTGRWALAPKRVTEPDVVGADIFADLTLHRNGICELRIGFHPFPNSLPGDTS